MTEVERGYGLTYAVAEELVMRFSGLKRFPRSEKSREELILAMRTAKDLESGVQFVTHWMKWSKDTPYPVDIYQHFLPGRELKHVKDIPFQLPDGNWAPARYHCNLCEDTGFYIIKTGQISFDGLEYTAAKKCPHPAAEKGEL